MIRRSSAILINKVLDNDLLYWSDSFGYFADISSNRTSNNSAIDFSNLGGCNECTIWLGGRRWV